MFDFLNDNDLCKAPLPRNMSTVCDHRLTNDALAEPGCESIFMFQCPLRSDASYAINVAIGILDVRWFLRHKVHESSQHSRVRGLTWDSRMPCQHPCPSK
jgi:hypothetical protein